MKNVAMCIFSFSLAVCTQASPYDQNHASHQTHITSVKISPTGSYLAVKIQGSGKNTLTFLDRKTLLVMGGLAIPGNKEVGDFFWANDDRVVSEIHRLSQGGKSTFQGEILAINFDGTQKSLIQAGATLKIVDPLQDNDGHILVSSKPLSDDVFSEDEERGIATLLNIYKDSEQSYINLLPDIFANFSIDNSGNIQMVFINSETEGLHLSAK